MTTAGWGDIEYTIHKKPVSQETAETPPKREKPGQEKSGQGKPGQGNPPQLNTDLLNTERAKTDGLLGVPGSDKGKPQKVQKMDAKKRHAVFVRCRFCNQNCFKMS
ncbi:MAG: hypothetical protein HFI74_10720 [Lachnospiraceae bacterium]|nr:hypothetical protein [Lachnospiraceae bacterium]